MDRVFDNVARFLIVGDVHWRGVSPRGRLDNILEALTAKLREVFELALEYGVLAILQPGDLTDSPGISFSTLGDLMDVLKRAPCHFLTIPGNHDIYGANATSLIRTPLGLLQRISYVENVAVKPVDFDCDESPIPVNIMITGHGYDAETDTDKTQYCPIEILPGYLNIHLAHGMLLERAPGHDMRHTLLSEIPLLPNPPHVLICGHDHTGFGIKQVGKTLCINPGALCRLSASATEMERPVQVALLEITESGQARAKLIPLKSAKPGHEVLSREHLDAEAVREERMSAFLGLLAEEGEARFLETREIIDDIARREKLPGLVVKEALDRLGRAREELGGSVMDNF